jgi:general L-amino acid transport system permease protein
VASPVLASEFVQPVPLKLPPARHGHRLAWIRRNFFANPFHLLMTALIAYAGYRAAAALVPWAVLDATWIGSQRADCVGDGACWAFVTSRIGQFVYGFYPEAERWRVNVAFALLAAGIGALMVPRVPRKGLIGVGMLTVYPAVAFVLIRGGIVGLPPVETDRWGGLFLTLVIGVTGIVASFPIGIALALGRRSHMPVIRALSAAFIELWRGLPLVTILFMSLVALPLFLPSGLRFNELALALVGISIFAGAYLAEVVRGGLEAIPRGQYEAARALGLGYWHVHAYIILPQALRAVTPGIVNNAIALFKDTTLVMIVGLFDLLNIVTAGASDPRWLGSAAEGYVFAAAVFWIFCFGFSRYSQHLERRLQPDRPC